MERVEAALDRPGLVGFTAMGKRRVVTVSGRTKTEAKAKLREVMRDHQDGFPTERRHRTVAEAVEDWLAHGMGLQEPSTVVNRAILARTHLVPVLGRRRLVELTVHDVDAWLAGRATMLSTDTVHRLTAAQGRCFAGRGPDQSSATSPRWPARLRPPPVARRRHLMLGPGGPAAGAAEADSRCGPTSWSRCSPAPGPRSCGRLTWDQVDLERKPTDRRGGLALGAGGGDTKTRSSAGPLSCRSGRPRPSGCTGRAQRHVQLAAGDRWQGAGLAFCTSVGTALDAANVRRSFRRVAAAAGLDAQAWTPRELRHSFVLLLSSTGMSIEDISHLVGHASSRVTELVYRKELRPVLTRGASATGRPLPA